MNSQQIAAISRITGKTDSSARYSLIGNCYINGPIIWNCRKVGVGDYYQLNGTNVTVDRQWFMPHIFISAIIGKRGGIKILTAEGMSKKLIK